MTEAVVHRRVDELRRRRRGVRRGVVGSLTPAMAARYLPLVQTVERAGMPVTAQGVLTKKEGKRKAHALLPSEYTCGLLIETATR